MQGRHPFEASPLRRMRREMDRLFHQFLPELQSIQQWAHLPMRGYPPINLWEDEGTLQLEAELPGISEKELDITISGNELLIKGKRAPDDLPQDATPILTERELPEFSRAIHLPCETDHDRMEASLKHGVLNVTMPKVAAARSRQIKVRPVAGAAR
jgi:HSP20 family protein